jgi:hypothetical protein
VDRLKAPSLFRSTGKPVMYVALAVQVAESADPFGPISRKAFPPI